MEFELAKYFLIFFIVRLASKITAKHLEYRTTNIVRVRAIDAIEAGIGLILTASSIALLIYLIYKSIRIVFSI